jgi:hypothetical protein
VSIAVEASDVNVTYERLSDESDCGCTYDFDFIVYGLAPGDFTVHAGSSTATVTVL